MLIATLSNAFRSVFDRAILGIVSIVVLLTLGTSLKAQEYLITQGSIVTCAGALLDAGGGLAPYGDNEDNVLTICPDVPGQGITLNFLIAQFSLAGAGSVDQMEVFDGDDLSAPLLGTYVGNELEGVILSASPDNPTGCLTLHFTTNEVGGGDFSAVIQCQTPCYPPVPDAIVVGEDLPALVCSGETMTFDASTSTASAGQTIVSYEWDLADGSTGSGAVLEHSYTEPGEYLVQLTVTDDAGCVNTQQTTLQVFVSTVPSFAGTMEDLTVCEGATIQLDGVTTPTTWSGIPVIDLGGPIPLPDNVGVPFTSSLDYSIFPIGSTLTDVNDLESICVDMEHSFMGDMVLVMTCPNGQSVALHQQGGGGTFLGDANDTDPAGSVAVPGTCYTYCFAPNAPFGTWAQCSQFGTTPNVIPVSQGTALAPGTYTSVQPLSNLVGCPLNGTWTFTLIDQLFIDNGVICNWSINFDPSLYPDVTSFTPVIGSTSDSVTWSGPGVVQDPDNGYFATATMNDPGAFDYTLTVTDNFGCSYDTTITVTVTPAPIVEATAVLGAACSDPATLFATIVANPPPPPTCTYTLVLEDSFGDGWNGGAQITVNVAGVPNTYTVPPGTDEVTQTFTVQTGQVIQLVFTAGTTWNNENSFTLFGPSGNVVFASPNGPPSGVAWQGAANCGAGVGPPVYQWTPAAGVVNPNGTTTLTQITEPTEFVIRVHTFGQPWCGTSDTIMVQPPSVLQNDSSVVDALCNASDGSITIVTTGTGGPWNYDWTDASGQDVRNVQASNGDVFNTGVGTYTVVITEGPLGNGCIDTITATIVEPEPLVWVTTPNDTLICRTGTAQLVAQASGGTGAITLTWNQGLSGNGPHAVSPSTNRLYTVLATDANGCTLELDSTTVFVNPALSLPALEPVTECAGVPIPLAALGGAGGDGSLTYDWGTGPGASPFTTVTLYNDTTICVTLSDGCETPDVTRCVPITILQTPPMAYSADTTIGCSPLPVRFTFVDTTGGAAITWILGDGYTSVGSTSFAHTYGTPGQYDVGVEVIWPNGCATDTVINSMISVIAVPVADFTWSPQPPNILEPLVEFQDLSVPNVVSWEWTFHEAGSSDEQNPTFSYPTDVGGYYPVTLVVTNELGCADTTTRIVFVEDLFLVFVPNTFTPNGDGHNELFYVNGNDIATDEFELRIFDRWGGEVFGTTDRFASWDGSFGGTILPQGIYNYRLSVRSAITQQERIIYGHVNLMR
jgi:gliding motility-associated-like protein